MDTDGEGLASTTSLCPTCLEQVPGRYEARDGSVHLTRTCPDHGTTSREVRGSLDHWKWASQFGPDNEGGGDLTVESDHACLAVVEDTRDHREDLLAMRDELAGKVNYEGLLGERGQRALDAIETLEAAVEDGTISYLSLVATAE